MPGTMIRNQVEAATARCRAELLMRYVALFAALLAAPCTVNAAPLSTADCAKAALQAEGSTPAESLDLAALARDGDREVAAAARRLTALQAEASTPRAALVNATQDLRYQLQVCARR